MNSFEWVLGISLFAGLVNGILQIITGTHRPLILLQPGFSEEHTQGFYVHLCIAQFHQKCKFRKNTLGPWFLIKFTTFILCSYYSGLPSEKNPVNTLVTILYILGVLSW